MTAALLPCAYALIVAWSAPVLLTPLTSHGISARLGLTAWLTAMASVLAWRYGRHVQRARHGTRAHAEAARVTGRPLAGVAVVLDSPQRVAYCVPGRPAAIVPSSGALAVLEPAQLTAVLAHERAHLAGRHHLLIAATRGLGASFPAVPLFNRGPAELARLTEMCADDVAVPQQRPPYPPHRPVQRHPSPGGRPDRRVRLGPVRR